MKIAPSILSCDFYNLENELKDLNNLIDIIHLDVMDGIFVPNISFGMPIIKSLKKNTNYFLDTHLMIFEPEKYIDDFIKSGSDLITIHYEATKKIDEIITKIKSKNKKIGISIKPDTDVKVLDKYLDKIDLVLIMSVEPGFGGQQFIDNSISKANYLIEKRKEDNLNFLIEVDGGINDKTIKLINADIYVVGSYLMNKENKKEVLKKLYE